MSVAERRSEAIKVIEGCATPVGFHASTQAYPELWMRDLSFSTEVLLELGYSELIRRHLEEFLKMQRPDGHLPTVVNSRVRRVMNQSFHFWTSDTEIHFVLVALKYSNFTGDSTFLKEHQEGI